MGIHVLILAGGSGTRLWPLSREDVPKQFLSVFDGKASLLQQTVMRIREFSEQTGGTLHIIAAKKFAALVSQQMAEITIDGDLLLEEPEGRNTAPAIALGLTRLLQKDVPSQDTVIVLPSDHLIRDESGFRQAVQKAVRAAGSGNIVLFGVVPLKPETGFGYVKTVKTNNSSWRKVESFVEKPDLETAQKYVESNAYFWNAGIFCFRIKDMVEAYRNYFPEGARIFNESAASRKRAEAAFLKVKPVSIDYAVMEHAQNIVCIELNAGWSDVGSWDAVWENSPHDENHNAVSGDVCLHNCEGVFVHGGKKLIAAVNLKDIVIVDTNDALFIAPRQASQEIRAVVQRISKERCSASALLNKPWGTCEFLEKQNYYQIKRIILLPGKEIPFHYHRNSSGHLTVLKGTVIVDCFLPETQPQSRPLGEGESILIEKGFIHHVANNTAEPCEIIEVQTGDCSAEDYQEYQFNAGQ
ncbi:MAG: mannose-1-phosphate guanylyltransferase/mannose-6-phosphate isomerase [Spirochaetaceae bacterium]|jgi:mannose-1-phosphate guanylyltransferase/mannose-6-phosphate isomerase|nr:mannose-1-phosphate guanylyltransferase/mannose-6-phosphate isomerase [Spirochaetaceae bacterium]